MSNRKTILLGDICEITSSKRVKMADYVDAGVPFYRSKEIIEKSNGNDISTELFISHEHFEKIKSKFGAPIAGDILLTSVGTLGIPYQVKTKDKFYFKDGNLTWFRNFSDRVNPKFLYYWLSSPVAKRKFDEVTIGSTQKALTIVALKSIEIELPSIQVQNHIVIILDSLNSKLSNNRQTNQILEQIAQSIFKSWFVDIEPTRAKVIVKQKGGDEETQALAAQAILCGAITLAELDTLSNKQSSLQSALRNLIQTKLTVQNGDKQNHNWLPEQLVVIADFFPNALVNSELGEIPMGWNILGFKDIVEKYIDNRGKTPPITESGIPLLEVKHLPEGAIKPDLNTSKYVDNETFESWFRAHLETDDIIISTVGTIGRICMVPKGVKIAIAQNLLGMRFKREIVSPYFMYYQMNGYRFKHDVDARLVITVQASIKRKDLETIDLLSPPITLQNQFERFVKPFIAIQQSHQETELKKLRDIILPKLLSGELSVNIPTMSKET